MTKYCFDLASFPLRETHSHKAQMVSEILYGETFSIIERKDSWLKIRLEHDGYTGWLEREDPFVEANYTRNFICKSVQKLTLNEGRIYIPIGSMLTHEENAQTSQNCSFETVLKSFLNTPYLWGGRSFGGIDCSGFSQVSFATQGIKLPRDAYEQAAIGLNILFDERQFGDLAFFSNKNNRITHVGVVLEDGNIIHASEKVRIDQLRETGIYRTSLNKETHRLAHIKRLF